MMKLLLLLVPVAALRTGTADRPLCKKANDVAGWPIGPGGAWKVMNESKYDKMPDKIARGPRRGLQVGCEYEKFMMFEPKTCRLPYNVKEVPVKPKRILFMGDSVMDNAATSFSWFYQKENRITDQKWCKFEKPEMEEHMYSSGLFSNETIAKTIRWMVKQGGNNRRNGHVWWGCKNSTVLYVPTLILEEEDPDVIKAFMYTAKTFAEEPLGPQDVMVLNWGLHGLKDGKKTDLAHMDKKWTPALTMVVKEWAQWKKEGTAPKLIWREVSPQHFAGGGNWNKEVQGKKCQDIGNKNLQAKDNTKYPVKNSVMFRTAVEENGLTIDGQDIEILPIWRASSDRFDEHPNGDCTHFCIFGAVHRYWNSALLAVASGMLQATPKKTALKVHGKGTSKTAAVTSKTATAAVTSKTVAATSKTAAKPSPAAKTSPAATSKSQIA